ncbi:MAG: DUF4185 domain-containing protein [Nocardioidaceae bacterium]
MRRSLIAASALPLILVAAAGPGAGAREDPGAPPSTYVGTADIEERESVGTASDGDLWPSCWANDGNLYTANGDGKGFSLDGPFSDIAVNRVEGEPPNLSGETLARGDEVGTIWSGDGYNRKPTGMVCVGDTIYLAVQDLALDFNDVPAATIVKSTDGGKTWTWDRDKPMFTDHVFTTVWFADFGRGSAWAPDRYVYAYGLDGNWRDSFDDSVEDPEDVFLARVPQSRVQDRGAWQFFTGIDHTGRPGWSRDIGARSPVLHDGRRLYEQTYSTNRVSDLSVISQGGVTYVPGLDRYLYASWTEYTFELYESPTPWGPWKHFMSKDFGGYPWDASQHGGYATTIPSKFLSADGHSMWVQSNVCPCGGGGTSVYRYSLRRLDITPAQPAPASNPPDERVNLAAPSNETVAVSKSTHHGRLDLLNDGVPTGSEDDFDDEVKSSSWWGHTWPRRQRLNSVELTSGQVFEDGGWFTGRPIVEVRRDGRWDRATAQTVSPAYPGDATAGTNQTYTITFLPVEADGVRVIGVPGGSRTFTSVAELAVRYATQVADGGFESPAGGPSAWDFEGTANHGVDRGLGFARSGGNNGWIRTSGTGWSAYSQRVPVVPGSTYTFHGWTRTSAGLTDGRFGVRLGDDGSEVLDEEHFGASADYVERTATVRVPEGVHEVTVYAGFVAPGSDTFLQLDDISVERATP